MGFHRPRLCAGPLDSKWAAGFEDEIQPPRMVGTRLSPALNRVLGVRRLKQILGLQLWAGRDQKQVWVSLLLHTSMRGVEALGRRRGLEICHRFLENPCSSAGDLGWWYRREAG